MWWWVLVVVVAILAIVQLIAWRMRRYERNVEDQSDREYHPPPFGNQAAPH
jgi:membrane protein implicated in regulation of membrane protease activity